MLLQIMDFFNKLISSLIDQVLFASNVFQEIKLIVDGLELSTSDHDSISNSINSQNNEFNYSPNYKITPESSAASYADNTSRTDYDSEKTVSNNLIANFITHLDNDFSLFWQQVLGQIWVKLAAGLNTIIKTVSSMNPSSDALFNQDKIPYMAVMYFANLFIERFNEKSESTMNNLDLDPNIRTEMTFIYDYAAFGCTTVYLSIVDQVTQTFGEYFGFLSINAKYQQYWTALTWVQHFIANKFYSPVNNNFQFVYAIFGMLKIAWTFIWCTSWLLNIKSDTSSWPAPCIVAKFFIFFRLD